MTAPQTHPIEDAYRATLATVAARRLYWRPANPRAWIALLVYSRALAPIGRRPRAATWPSA